MQHQARASSISESQSSSRQDNDHLPNLKIADVLQLQDEIEDDKRLMLYCYVYENITRKVYR